MSNKNTAPLDASRLVTYDLQLNAALRNTKKSHHPCMSRQKNTYDRKTIRIILDNIGLENHKLPRAKKKLVVAMPTARFRGQMSVMESVTVYHQNADSFYLEIKLTE